ncbi:MAG: HutD family protein [Planktomarina sp.]
MHKYDLPDLYHIARSDFHTKPWKNGKGTTHDILMLPDGCDHTSFDLRFALSPIIEAGVFSTFPGADRVITLVEGQGLDLRFETHCEHLMPLQCLHFDTGLAPIGTPSQGGVAVINVMAKRDIWQIAACHVVPTLHMECGDNDLVFVYALQQDCSLNIDGTRTWVDQANAVLLSGPSMIDIEGLFLYAHLTPGKPKLL